MRFGTFQTLSVGVALALSACGGGGNKMSFTPPPPAPPAPPPPTSPSTAADYIVAATGPNQLFESTGGYVSFDPSSGQPLSVATGGDQLKIRYNSGSGQYEIQLPVSTSWEGIYLNPGMVPNTRDFRTSGTSSGSGGPTFVQLQEFAGTGFTHSALALWSIPSTQAAITGGVAFGIPTPPGSVPTTGTATYNGSITGRSTQTSFDGLGGSYWTAIVEGSISLSFNFGAGTLAGSISPTIYDYERRALAPMSFVNTVYSTGSTTFSGSFNTNLPGANSFSGQFTGPQAKELIGNFAFPYSWDGKTYDANGAFVAKQ